MTAEITRVIRTHAGSADSAAPPAGEFTELARRIKDSGLMRRRYGYYWTKLLAVPVVFAAAIALFIWIGDTWWQMFTRGRSSRCCSRRRRCSATTPPIGRSSGRASGTTGSASSSATFVGMSYGWWQHKHTRHHANPNKVGVDPDIELPVVSFTPEQASGDRDAGHRLGDRASGGVLLPDPAARGTLAARVERATGCSPARARSTAAGSRSPSSTVRIGGYLALVFLVLSPGQSRSRSSASSSACSASTWACRSRRTTRACRSCRRT